MEIIRNPPNAASLMMSARSFGNYDLAGALADLIDNSVKANAQNVWIRCLYDDGEPEVVIRDDGHGMSRDELHAAMRPASTNPTSERSPNDLGRFGWGLKTASFSQCRELIVLSTQDYRSSGAVWDLDNIDNWTMGVFSRTQSDRMLSSEFEKGHGTEVVWKKCDRLSEGRSLNSTNFNETIRIAGDKLALVFHRLIEGKSRKYRKLNIEINGTPLEPFDPFYSEHPACQVREKETITISKKRLVVQPYVLPHFSKLSEQEQDRLQGSEGIVRNQGFYVYRNDRLIIHGTWFGLAKHGDLSQLARISIDIPNSMDDLWKITVDKSDAQLPSALKKRLRQIVDGLKKKSARVYTGKGGNLGDNRSISVWARHAKHNEIKYSINKKHPVLQELLDSELSKEVYTALRLIEQNFPVSQFSNDASSKKTEIYQGEISRNELYRLLDLTIPKLMSDETHGQLEKVVEALRHTEPFDRYEGILNDYITKKGWLL